MQRVANPAADRWWTVEDQPQVISPTSGIHAPLTRTFFVAVAAAMLVIIARGRLYPSLVVFFRPFSIDPIEAANLRQSQETTMSHVLHLQQARWRTLEAVGATIRAIVRAVSAEHALAQQAATKAALPRQSLAEVRAMYVSTREPQHEGDVVAQSTKCAS
jgi:hypothetical protein